jgi:hypothetical protein
MYKKITHHITEEHFAHPGAAQIKKVVDTRAGGIILVKVAPEKFRTDVQAMFDLYLANMNSIIASVTGTQDDLVAAEETLFATIDDLGRYLKPYYGIEFGEKITHAERSLALAMIQTVRFLRSGLDVKDWTAFRFNKLLVNDIAQFFSLQNNAWKIDDVRTIFNRITASWVNQAQAYMDKNPTNVTIEIQNAKAAGDILVSAIVDGTTLKYPEMFL